MKIADFDAEAIAEMFEFLDKLREGGSVNMFGAGPYLAAEFEVSRLSAINICVAWSETFDRESSPADRAKTALADAGAALA